MGLTGVGRDPGKDELFGPPPPVIDANLSSRTSKHLPDTAVARCFPAHPSSWRWPDGGGLFGVGFSPTSSVIHGDTVPTVAQLGPTSFAGPGPFAAGVTTLSLRANGPLVEIWYPAAPASVKGHTQASYNVADWLPPALRDLIPAEFEGATYKTDAYRGVPVAAGRFPLVVFTHGYSGFRDQSTFLTTRLASWGFVVAASDLPDNDLTAVLSGAKSQGITADIAEQQQVITLMGDDAQASGRFHSHIDRSRVAAIGHSLGGAISEALAGTDPRVTTFIGMAGATVGSFGQTASGPTSVVPDKPGMLMVARLTRLPVRPASPKRLPP